MNTAITYRSVEYRYVVMSQRQDPTQQSTEGAHASEGIVQDATETENKQHTSADVYKKPS